MSFGDLERNMPTRGAGNPSQRPTQSSNLASQPFSSNPRQYGAAPSGRGDVEYLQLNERLTSSIYQLNSTTQEIVRLSERIGTKKDTADTREELQRKVEAGTDIVKRASDEIKRLSSLNTENSADANTRKAQLNKLQSQFKVAVQDFQTAQKSAVSKTQVAVARARAASQDASAYKDEPPSYSDNGREPLLRQQQHQKHVTLDLEIQANEEVIAEREHDIHQIEAAITEVNEIFRDLASMVNEQQTMVDSIESNTEKASTHVQLANKELAQAQKSQKSSRKKLCIILTIVVLLAGGVVALVLLFK